MTKFASVNSRHPAALTESPFGAPCCSMLNLGSDETHAASGHWQRPPSPWDAGLQTKNSERTQFPPRSQRCTKIYALHNEPIVRSYSAEHLRVQVPPQEDIGMPE